jgi:hypothetical protein
MYLHQAMKEDDWPKFKKAMQKEVDDHSKIKNWEPIHKNKVPSRSHCPSRSMVHEVKKMHLHKRSIPMEG